MKKILIYLLISSFTFTSCSSLFDKDEFEYQDCTGFVDDGRGRYTKIKIGDQCWLKEDVQYTVNTVGSYRFTTMAHNNHLFYFTYTAYDKGICPLGFQIPSADEWQKLGEQVNRLENSKRGYLLLRVETFYYKNSLTNRKSYNMMGEDIASSWLIRENSKMLASYTDLKGLTLVDMPIFYDDTHPVTGVGTKEYGYFSIKCIRIESY